MSANKTFSALLYILPLFTSLSLHISCANYILISFIFVFGAHIVSNIVKVLLGSGEKKTSAAWYHALHLYCTPFASCFVLSFKTNKQKKSLPHNYIQNIYTKRFIRIVVPGSHRNFIKCTLMCCLFRVVDPGKISTFSRIYMK